LIHRLIADNTNPGSLASRLRRQRFRLLLELTADFARPVRVLDVGGRPKYWEMMAAGTDLAGRLEITLLNPEPHPVGGVAAAALVGDGRAMPQFADGQFDLVFSNSTIEHVGSLADQQRMAAEVQRVGRRYYVQTPNRYFPIEPHFVFPFFQFLPLAGRTWLLQRFRLGWYGPIPDREAAWNEVSGVRLLSRAELAALFPGGQIYTECFLGLAKSFVVYGGRAGAGPK